MKSEELDIFSKVKHFVLDEYNGSQNAEEWINIFEKECDRLRVDLDVSKIQILRLFLEENAVEWYKATLSKFSINGTWNQWSQLFLDTYAGKNWSQVFHAFNYRYIRGSLLDYALKKERLLLETDAKITETTRINLIACGLPSYVYNKFNIKENKQIFRTISGVTCVDNIVKLPLKIHNIEKTIDAHVLKNDNFSYDILLGLDVIKEFNLIQDDKLNILQRNPENDKIECVTNYKQNELISQLDKKQVSPESNCINDSRHKVINLNINFDECIKEIAEKSLEHLNENEKIKILEMIKLHEQAFAKHKFDDDKNISANVGAKEEPMFKPSSKE
ncbi:hypothetical protein WA026_014126 [Henosepilachna vigintioctopunctata]|uniref:Retrotransposon gag domain-containing protein n=1 Tax=Henosepilachna vigintioctopunctata TaxID=420089 RepID=A0AAW1TSL1_9CUCU